MKIKFELEPPTDRQIDLIFDIEQEVGVEFTGKTKQEASEFISLWKDHISRDNSVPRYKDEDYGDRY